jgi:nicotinamidase/pyrazinamidase
MIERFKNSALILVDIQNDFCSDGALPVKDGEQVVEVANTLMQAFPLVVATQDWHPPNHCSFQEQGGAWPPHCVQNSTGAQLHPLLNQKGIDYFFRKAFTPEKDCFSGFEAVDERGVSLDEVLRKRRVKKVFVTGLATDYCVKATANAALTLGYDVFIVTDAIRPVDVVTGDGEKALAELVNKGARLIKSAELLKKSRTASAFGD